MNILKILGYGLLAVGAVFIITAIRVRRDRIQQEKGLETLKTMTPERLFANCGHPLSDSEQEPADMPVAFARVIEYKAPQTRYWAKLEFSRTFDNQLRPTRWRLTHFASPTVGVNTSDANAFIAIPILPCLAQTP